MADIFCVRDEKNRLIPADQYSLEYAKKIKLGEVCRLEAKKGRCYEFLQKFMVLVNKIFEIQSHFDNVKALRSWLTMKAGYFTSWVSPKTGKLIYEVDSISFAKMHEDDFAELFSKVIDIALDHSGICGGVKEEKLIEEYSNAILSFTKKYRR